jgi:hypothetical protein
LTDKFYKVEKQLEKKCQMPETPFMKRLLKNQRHRRTAGMLANIHDKQELLASKDLS